MCLAAPAPKYKPKPASVPSEGVWEASWNNVKYIVHLEKDNQLSYRWAGDDWHGTWYWDHKTRTLHTTECKLGNTLPLVCEVQLDGDLVGTMHYHFSGNTSSVAFSLKKTKP